MTGFKMSYAAYATTQQATETGRDLEIRAISYVTRNLEEGNRPDAEPLTRIRALNGNVRLWTMLTEDLASPDNTLPDALKASYISLGIFARRTSLAALSAPASLASLIKINTDVLDALGQQRQAAA